MRNVAAVGATPWTATDCLNYGNPEKPEQMWELVEGIRGIKDALEGVGHLDFEGPLAIISETFHFIMNQKWQCGAFARDRNAR